MVQVGRKGLASEAEIGDEEPAFWMALLAGQGALHRFIGNEAALVGVASSQIIAAGCRSHRKAYNFLRRDHQQVEIQIAYGSKHT
jgi:hypothetical protein